MSKHTIKGFVTYQKFEWETKPEIGFTTYDPRENASEYDSRVVVCEHSIVVDIPDDFDPRASKVAALQKDKLRLQAEFAKKLMEIEDDISKLLCIEQAVTV